MKKMTITVLAILASMSATTVVFAGEEAAPKTCTATFNQAGTTEAVVGGGTQGPQSNEAGSAETHTPPPRE